MMERPWYVPGIGFGGYLRKYPIVSICSLLCSFCWVFKADIPWVLINPSTPLANMGRFEPWPYCALLGIPLFSLLHLLLHSPRMKYIKTPIILHALGFTLLFWLF